MSIQADSHTLQVFDGELNHLHHLKLEMAKLLLNQLQQAMLALDKGDMELAEQVILQDREVNRYEIDVDAEVLRVLACHCPLANDLRTVISTSKIAVELERIGNEITDFAKLITVLFDPKSSDPNPKLLTDIVKIGSLVRFMLEKLIILFESEDSNLAYAMLAYDSDCESELQKGIKHQLSFVVQDARLTGRALDIMQIMKSLERCGEFCRNIAEYMIFLIDGIDVRHRDQVANTDFQ